MKKLLLAVLVGAIGSYALPAAAQVGVELNAAHAGGIDGVELGVGYAVHTGPIRITPAVGALFYKGDNDRYNFDNNGGNPRCRDSTSGRYAESWRCNNVAAKAYGRLEAVFETSVGFSIGAGARVSELSAGLNVTPYGNAAFSVTRKLRVKGNIGKDYYAGGLSLGF